MEWLVKCPGVNGPLVEDSEFANNKEVKLKAVNFPIKRCYFAKRRFRNRGIIIYPT